MFCNLLHVLSQRWHCRRRKSAGFLKTLTFSLLVALLLLWNSACVPRMEKPNPIYRVLDLRYKYPTKIIFRGGKQRILTVSLLSAVSALLKSERLFQLSNEASRKNPWRKLHNYAVGTSATLRIAVNCENMARKWLSGHFLRIHWLW